VSFGKVLSIGKKYPIGKIEHFKDIEILIVSHSVKITSITIRITSITIRITSITILMILVPILTII